MSRCGEEFSFYLVLMAMSRKKLFFIEKRIL
jgi:hypothetical protein